MRPIDGDALIKEICRDQCEMEAKGCGSRCELVIYVDDTPTVDAVPVVRCKDCKDWDKGNPFDGSEMCECKLNGGHYWPNDFCSYGERREE